jgi:hypothetical protein
MLVCFIYFAREAAGASSARHSLRPLIFQGQEFKANLARNKRRDRGHVCGNVIASEAKQSISPRKGRMDCFVALLLAMTMDRLFEN